MGLAGSLAIRSDMVAAAVFAAGISLQGGGKRGDSQAGPVPGGCMALWPGA